MNRGREWPSPVTTEVTVADRQYRMVFIQDDSVDHLSEIPMTAAEAYEQLGTSMALHIITGWSVQQCDCGHGFIASRGDVTRAEHVERVEGIEDLALALGILYPESRDATRDATVVSI